jgi:hypothetical protein
MSWEQKSYKRCDGGHAAEFRTLEECAHDRSHRSELERSRDELTKDGPKNPRRVWSVKPIEPQERLIHQLRANRALMTAGDGQGVTVGLDTPKWRGTRLTADMPSQDGMGVRSCSAKLRRAEFYGPQWHRKTGRGGSSNRDVDWAELRKALEQ